MMTWQSVRADVLARIRDGYWKPGELIPTEIELAAEFGCARATINRALTSLAATGLLERRRKVGTRVAAHPPQQSTLPGHSLRDEIEGDGAIYGYRLTSFRMGIAPSEVTQEMMLDAGSTLIEVRAEYTANGKPYCAEEFWINPQIAPSIDEGAVMQDAACDWLVRNIAMDRGSLDVSATSSAIVDPSIGTFLECRPGDPLLLVRHVLWSGPMVVSFSRQHFPQGHKRGGHF